MSKFKKNNAIGKAGEHYFAYWIMSTIGWPCRLLDLDIGLDAHIEILNHQQHSTGDFIAVQIKTTGTNIPEKTVYKKHLEYWKELDDQFIYISISNALGDYPKIYWKHFDKDTIADLHAKIIENGTNSIELSLDESDVLSTDNIKNLAGLKYATVIEDYLTKGDDICVAYSEFCYFFTCKEYLAGDDYIEKWEMKVEPDETAILDLLSQADNIFRSFESIDDTKTRYPKIDHAANVNVNIDWDIRGYIDEILKVLIKHVEYRQKEILSYWAKENPSSKVLTYY